MKIADGIAVSTIAKYRKSAGRWIVDPTTATAFHRPRPAIGLHPSGRAEAKFL
jgi:hypothetical protein